ncbi:MAG: histidine phosphatase family protein [Rhodospirillaceae bacterium]|jgi:alpha-ribazole phosphatase|nr:histidine phosphatase family protein [Rhodospirillaceae bacterium]MBT4941073.1 histidine phosphatase family protein [Rhodospirillaceae bacterium]MBT7265357.1 histidine phosphatase family protein [Rhodospirillaceae bacterium]
MSNTHWWWVRHAPSAGTPGIIHGQDDVDADLSDQAALAARRKSLPEDAIWLTSGLPRAVQTAEALGGSNCRAVPGLMEQDFGEWNGKNWDDLRDDHAIAFWQNFATQAPPGGESFIHMMDRVSDTIAELSLEYQGKNIIAVTHAGTIRTALAMALNLFAKSALAFQLDNLSLTEIENIPDGDLREWCVHGINR